MIPKNQTLFFFFFFWQLCHWPDSFGSKPGHYSGKHSEEVNRNWKNVLNGSVPVSQFEINKVNVAFITVAQLLPCVFLLLQIVEEPPHPCN